MMKRFQHLIMAFGLVSTLIPIYSYGQEAQPGKTSSPNDASTDEKAAAKTPTDYVPDKKTLEELKRDQKKFDDAIFKKDKLNEYTKNRAKSYCYPLPYMRPWKVTALERGYQKGLEKSYNTARTTSGYKPAWKESYTGHYMDSGVLVNGDYKAGDGLQTKAVVDGFFWARTSPLSVAYNKSVILKPKAEAQTTLVTNCWYEPIGENHHDPIRKSHRKACGSEAKHGKDCCKYAHFAGSSQWLVIVDGNMEGTLIVPGGRTNKAASITMIASLPTGRTAEGQLKYEDAKVVEVYKKQASGFTFGATPEAPLKAEGSASREVSSTYKGNATKTPQLHWKIQDSHVFTVRDHYDVRKLIQGSYILLSGNVKSDPNAPSSTVEGIQFYAAVSLKLTRIIGLEYTACLVQEQFFFTEKQKTTGLLSHSVFSKPQKPEEKKEEGGVVIEVKPKPEAKKD